MFSSRPLTPASPPARFTALQAAQVSREAFAFTQRGSNRDHAALLQSLIDGVQAVIAGTFTFKLAYQATRWRRTIMDGIIYLVGLIVIIMAILSFFGLR
jgi:hypothetical protein